MGLSPLMVGGVGEVLLSGRRVGIYVFITRTRLQRFTRLTQSCIEMRGVRCDYQRVKKKRASWRQREKIKKGKDGYVLHLYMILPFDSSFIEGKNVN